MITQERLKEMFDYDPAGYLVNRYDRGVSKKGKVPGRFRKNGYFAVFVDGKEVAAHKLIWIFHTGKHPTYDLDHINNNRADNRIENLREATRSENMQNEKKARSTNKSGFLGVSKNNGRWRAQIELNYQRTHIGYFDTPEEAYAAYLAKKRELHPFQTIA